MSADAWLGLSSDGNSAQLHADFHQPTGGGPYAFGRSHWLGQKRCRGARVASKPQPKWFRRLNKWLQIDQIGDVKQPPSNLDVQKGQMRMYTFDSKASTTAEDWSQSLLSYLCTRRSGIGYLVLPPLCIEAAQKLQGGVVNGIHRQKMLSPLLESDDRAVWWTKP